MKSPCSFAAALLSTVLFAIISNAQTTQSKLNQIELMKQMIGSWKSEISKDTIEYIETKSYGTGLECYKRYYSKDQIVMEGKQLYWYDTKNDKFILSGLFIGMDNQFCELWFKSKSICVVYPYSDILKLEKAPFYVELEIKSPDLTLFKLIVNNNIIKTYIITRVKN